jgi:glucokinase
MRFLVGVDLGGTNIVVGTVAENGSAIYGVRAEPTRPEEGAEAVVRRIAQLVDESVEEAGKVAGITRQRIAGVGIGSPGPLDRERGLVLVTPNLGWRDFPLRDLVSRAVELPATLDNDAN